MQDHFFALHDTAEKLGKVSLGVFERRFHGRDFRRRCARRQGHLRDEEFHLLQAALNIEDGLDGLRYNQIVIATDADVDGMHIRLLLLSFFLQFFPDVIRNNHLFILQTPLFRVRNKKVTRYCYSEQEKQAAVKECGTTHEITRFKGLGEISAGEFKDFIGENIRLDPINLHHLYSSDELLSFFMGKNTPERQEFIIENLRVEKDLVEV